MVGTVVVVTLVVAVAPLVVAALRRVVRVPLVAVEILLGLAVGPNGLNWVTDRSLLDLFSGFGLAMLFFMAGSEIEFREVRGRPLRRSALGWLVSLAAGLAIGIAVAPSATVGVYIGVALTSTALGTLLPILIDSGDLGSPFGTAVVAVGAIGEFGPLVAISVFLSSRTAGASATVLVAFVVLSAGAIVLAARGRHRGLHRLSAATLHTSGQFGVRLVMLVVTAMVALSLEFGLDMLLGAFTAGVLTQYFLASAPAADSREIRSKLAAVAFGFLVPIFFVETGAHFDLPALLHDRRALVLLPAFLVLFLLVRGLPGLLSAPAGASRADRGALVLMSGTALPIIVAVTAIGVDRGELPESLAGALVGAGLLSVLVFPVLALLVRGRPAPLGTGSMVGDVTGPPAVAAGDGVVRDAVPEEA
ncbi:cation:proton antiporter [Nakamurella endophytica]|uniref:Sodium/hydrogen exchanger n=1 Tax=Nakamurella endophytica TaxID=1748367 RepID=A0A917WH01_9ACTN|nr:cation:proton antiporter [Nakamurella endophytica]GGM05861.1 sodium/hydrogen exchanger [Nakamurella endophytica]